MRSIAKTLACAVLCVGGMSAPSEAADIRLHYLRQEVEQPPTLSNLEPVPTDEGRAGAELALEDNATTGTFMGQTWTLQSTHVAVDGDFTAAVREALKTTDLLVLDAPVDDVLAAADLPEAQDALLFNTAAPERALRDEACRANVLHTLPSRAMLTDALMQFFVARRWTAIVMIEGTKPGDLALGESYRDSAAKFGQSVRRTQSWEDSGDLRRNASQEVPIFTQGLGKYDVLVVADELNDFARYIPYNTWMPRPVAGSEGLRPSAWSPVVEQWGAAQLQSRFEDAAGRQMRDRDYAAWAAVRAVGEAVTRTGASSAPELRAYMLGDSFELAGFKGRPLTFRPWNGQLRQTIPLTHRGSVVANAPIEGFLHPKTELDTLGLDAPESRCTAFGK
ncbi:ABC transporter substrate binding protein (PQQ-dependent alcohol dehydrogenase system) [Sagittula marina]|uniref:ABC transporter substrate binding protein (PQQ-dependent alcohol dehydrogenase system) n=1 Tax=Sagittula marina TaxID=943940 RepID=A0A7W6GU91_9RHOB|nr:ABC transporter substrate-binding protein [Sagittula marina]MBB3987587.1 ABC transporter substrate binding protein (PQQ-dependent alcohol dehydrogenase system) [Sagittula marina]